MTYNEALRAGVWSRYLDDIIDRFNFWEKDNATRDDVLFVPHTDRDGVIWYGVRRKEAAA